MSKATVLGKTAKADLPKALFGEEFHQTLVHDAARADLAARRRGTASTLKGTGRARVGALSSPTRTGGALPSAPSRATTR